jgi:hypothetical protein
MESFTNNRECQLNQNRQQWRDFKRQLDDLEQAAAQQFINLDHLC